MRLVTLQLPDRPAVGVIVGSDILVISGAGGLLPDAGQVPDDMRALLGTEGALDIIRRLHDRVESASSLGDDLREAHALVPFEEAELLPPVTNPGVILSCGVNYRNHIKEMNGTAPPEPVSFVKSVTALNASGSPIVLPRDYPDMVDFEGELCVVIGKPCHKIERRDALTYVAGYTLANDVSARDWLVPQVVNGVAVTTDQAVFRNVLGKQYPTFCPLGPAIATCDEIPDPNDILLETYLNDQVMQSTNTNDMVFDVANLITFFAQFYKFMPGDIITTGSPSGVGFGRNPKIFMRPGDVVSVRSPQIGALTNHVVAPVAS